MQNTIDDETEPSQQSPDSLTDRREASVPAGIYKIYTALGDSKLVNMSLIENPDGSHNVELARDNNAPESRWEVRRETSSKNREIRNYRNQSLYLATTLGSDEDNVVAESIDRSQDKITKYGWAFWSAENGQVEIQNARLYKYMRVSGATPAEHANIILVYGHEGPQHKFRLVKVG